MLLSDMNLRIGNVRNYNNKILVSSPSFKIGTNLKINLDVKPKEVEMVKTEPDVKPKDEGVVTTKPDVKQKRNLMSSPIKNTNKMLNQKICVDHKICVDQNLNTCDKCPQVLRQPTNHFLSSIQYP